MGGERFARREGSSFFGDLIYDRVVPADHFLRQLEELVPWDQFTRKLVKFYRGKARQGRPPYEPAVLLKMLLVAYLYNLSERQTEVVASDSLSIKWFLGLAADEAPPDHSTLTAFKRRLIELPPFSVQVLCWSESGCRSERRSEVARGRSLGYWT